MLRERRIVKKILAMLLIMAMVLPYSAEVIAVALTQTDTTVMLETSIAHEGSYAYQIANSASDSDTEGRTTVFKIRKEGDNDFEDALYCLNAEKAFPSEGAQEYKNIGDLKDEMTTAGSSLINSIGTKNYQSLVWLIDNLYLPKAEPSEKLAFIEKVFATVISENTVPPTTAEYISSIITDDDIEVVQQWAIWYFTNGNNDGYSEEYAKYYNAKYSTFGTVYILGMDTNGEYVSLREYAENGAARQEFLNILYAYLVDNAKLATKVEKVTYPEFAMENANVTCTVDGDYYKVGPFNVKAHTAPASSYTIKLVDANGTEIPRELYRILVEGDTEFSTANVNEIFGKNYYIYLPIENNTITKVKLTIDYSVYETQASLWSVQTDDTYQPVTLITRGTTPYSDSREKDVETKVFDLALRKYIIKVDDTSVSNRIPEVNPNTITDNGTAEYKHPKNPVTLVPGQKVVYEIRVYNEGTLDGAATEITDYLPAGMTLTENSNINSVYGWTTSVDGRVVTTTYLRDTNISAYDGKGELESAYVQIECTIAENIADDLAENLTLTNVAEITGYSRTDKDSSKTIDPNTINTQTFTGNTSNKEDLSDSTYYYKGLEDDDDFEKVVIEPENEKFDLNLKKFITKINGVAPTVSREPKVDVANLKNGSSTNATYTQTKTSLEVKKGDIVTYKLRVYNEGDLAGYAETVSDFLPTGLGYLMNYNSNIANKWSIPENAKTVKLSEIENGTANVKAEDFSGTVALGDEIVVIGGGKFTSTFLASSTTSTANLLRPFDKENGTTLDYKDIEITCIVLTDTLENNNLKNIAEIAKETDENREDIIDVDSTPNSVDPNNYPNTEKDSSGKEQDDHDYENLKTPTPEYFDLALQKFITAVNNDKITNREPVVTKNDDGTFRYSHTSDALAVANTDLVTYTIRVYNEGKIDGYAKEIMDDIPTGLKYLPDNEVNKSYGWKMYDKNGAETTDVNQAVSVKTTYLSKENDKTITEAKPSDYTPEKYPYYTESTNILLAYNEETMKTPHYRDVQLVFQVTESALTNKTAREIINTAEITVDQDKDGKDVEDKDSIPGNKKAEEDDIDKEKVKVKYFDLRLKKTLAKIIITENGKTREIVPANENDLLKVEINRKYIKSTTVKFVYNITITNEGEIAGYAKEIKDYIPAGLVFKQADNPAWTAVAADCIKTEALANTLINPGASANVQVTLQWNNDENNLGEKINIAEISKDQNDKGSPDIDSTPDNKKAGEDDQDDAPVILSISTGEEPVYVVLSTTVLAILATGITLIKKYVLI